MIRWWLPISCLLAASPAGAALSQRDLATAVARPAAGAGLPARLVLTDLSGRTATLGTFAGGRPLVLIFADFTCRHICGAGLTLAAADLSATGLTAGRDYRLAVIGMDPRDSAADGRHFARAIAGRPDVARGTVVLRADAATIAAAARALGYGYVYDGANDQFAHDASVYVFAADGRLVTLLPELGLAPATLKAALTAQEAQPTQGWAARVAHLCYGFAAAHGRFARPVVVGLQLLSLLLLCLAALLVRRWRRAA